jgi:predicted aspartyl protease
VIKVRNKKKAISAEEFMKYCTENGLEKEIGLIKEMLEEIGRIQDEVILDELTGPGIAEELRKLKGSSDTKGKGKATTIEDEFEEKDINIEQFLSSENSDSEKESELSTEEESEPEEINVNMALEYNFKCDYYDGKEDPNDWINEFKRVAEINNWVDDDNNNCDALKMGIVHLKGDVKEWYNSLGTKPTRFSGGANNGIKLTEMLKANFPRQEIRETRAQNFENICQYVGESAESYIERIRKTVKGIGNEISNSGKARIAIKGTLPAIYSFAVIAGKNSTLEEAFESIRRGELAALGQAQQLSPSVEDYSRENEMLRKIRKEKKEEDIDDLTKMMKEMKVALMKLESGSGNNNWKKDIECYKCKRRGHYASECREIMEISCYACGRKGHISRNCRNNKNDGNRNEGNNRNNRNSRNNERNLNCIIREYSSKGSDEYNEGDMSDEESSSDEDYEKRVYIGKNDRILRSESQRERGIKRRKEIDDSDNDENMEEAEENNRKFDNQVWSNINTGNFGNGNRNVVNKRLAAIQKAQEVKRKKNKCRRCNSIGHWIHECPTLTKEERQWYERERQRNKEKRKEKMKKQVEFEEEFDILNSPSGLTMKQAMRYIPAYRKSVKGLTREKGSEKNMEYMERQGKSRSSVMRCNAGIEGMIVEAIIDSGAEVTAISRGLMDRLMYEIDEPSDIIIKSANDTKKRSLGRIRNIEVLLEGVEVIISVEVIENPEELLILGNNWIEKNVKNIDIENSEMRFKGRYGIKIIPIEMTREIGYEEEYEEEDLEESFC